HDNPGGGGGGPVERHEIGPRLLQVKAHDPGIDDLDLLDVLLQNTRAGALVPLEAELDILRRHRVAVVKLEARAQTELVSISDPAFFSRSGEARTHLLPGIAADERIMYRIEHAEGRDLRRGG